LLRLLLVWDGPLPAGTGRELLRTATLKLRLSNAAWFSFDRQSIERTDLFSGFIEQPTNQFICKIHFETTYLGQIF